IDHGAPVSLADNNNVTPLHLACKYQLKNIAELLLKAGAMANVSDNQGMSPLHYIILSQEVDCKSEKSTKIGTLIPEKKESGATEAKAISDELLAILYK